MKLSIFSKILFIFFFLIGISSFAQVRVKTNKGNSKKVIVKNKRGHYNTKNIGAVRVKSNRNRVVVSKPNRPRVVVTRPNYLKPGYVWVEGYWRWNNFFERYVWQKARWKKIKRNHIWVPGFWESSPAGFYWVEGYWALQY